jgi:MYXO-CTERM domain-containing protein
MNGSSSGSGGGPMDPLTLLASALVVGLVAHRRRFALRPK